MELIPYDLKLTKPIQIKGQLLWNKRGYYLKIQDKSILHKNPIYGLGEISPLTGLSTESYEDIVQELEKIDIRIVSQEIHNLLLSENSIENSKSSSKNSLKSDAKKILYQKKEKSDKKGPLDAFNNSFNNLDSFNLQTNDPFNSFIKTGFIPYSFSKWTSFPSIQFALSMSFSMLWRNNLKELFCNSQGKNSILKNISPQMAKGFDFDRISIQGLLQGDHQEILDRFTKLHNQGYNCFKVKVGRRDPSQENQLLKEILKAHEAQETNPVLLRLDGNRLLNKEKINLILNDIPRDRIEYLEEPLKIPNDLPLFYKESGYPLALDESVLYFYETYYENCDQKNLYGKSEIENLLIHIKAIIIKPTLIGDYYKINNIVSFYKKFNPHLKIIFSSSYESPFGLYQIAQVAESFSPKNAHGLNTWDIFQNSNLKLPFLPPYLLTSDSKSPFQSILPSYAPSDLIAPQKNLDHNSVPQNNADNNSPPQNIENKQTLSTDSFFPAKAEDKSEKKKEYDHEDQYNHLFTQALKFDEKSIFLQSAEEEISYNQFFHNFQKAKLKIGNALINTLDKTDLSDGIDLLVNKTLWTDHQVSSLKVENIENNKNLSPDDNSPSNFENVRDNNSSLTNLVLVDIKDPILFLEYVFAIMDLGFIPCLLNSFFGAKQIEQLLEDNHYLFIVSDAKTKSTSREIYLKNFDPISRRSGLTNLNRSESYLSLDSKIIFYTSGSVRSKACVHTLQSLFFNALGSSKNILYSQSDSWGLILPLFHVGGFSIIIRTLLSKAKVCLLKKEVSLWDQIHNLSITHLSLVSTQYLSLLNELKESSSTNKKATESLIEEDLTPIKNSPLNRLNSFTSLKAILLGGSAIPFAQIKEGSELLPLYKSYGMTEMGSQVFTTDRLSKTEIHHSGQILPFRELKIEDGEIKLRGPCLAKGYLIKNHIVSLTNSEGWFETKDLGKLDTNHNLIVYGRKDRIFQSGGENISPEIIESEILKIIGVEKVIVRPQEDLQYGKRAIAYIKKDPGLNNKDIDEILKKTLSGLLRPKKYLPWEDLPNKSWKT